MNYAQPTIDHGKIQYHASQLPQALEKAHQECVMLSNTLLKLADNHCTGSEHWRDANTDHRQPKLYIIHPLNGSCPIHGSPEPGKRIRTYVGADPAKIEEAQQAIDRNRHYNNAFRELQELHRRIHRAHADIQEAWDDLGLPLPIAPLTVVMKDADQE